jgi:glutamate formiminotransferase / 5-formyltetrahydrofolate cyclo-ligase
VSKTLLECVPNLSEGRNTRILSLLTQELKQLPELQILDFSADPDHHRSVFTWAAPPKTLEQALFILYEWAHKYIDLSTHKGAHPRIGAIDVVPIIPLIGITESETLAFVRQLAARLASHFELPLFLYEKSAQQPQRANLALIRKGQYEGLAQKMQNSEWKPDFGPAIPHPRLGASAIGVRDFLIAYNLFFGPQDLLKVKELAARLRASNGGLPAVKALGIWLPSRQSAQLSFNLTDFHQTPLRHLITEVLSLAGELGLKPAQGEIIGLLPEAAVWPGFENDLYLNQNRNFILEQHLKI